MPYKLECAQSFSSENATKEDIHHAFDDDCIRGEFIWLQAPNGDFIQAAGEQEGPFLLEYRLATGEQYQAEAECTTEQVRTAFIQFLGGDMSWRNEYEWKLLKTGCLSVLLIGASIITVVSLLSPVSA